MARTSGLSPKKRASARRAAVSNALLGVRHRGSIHYTQGPRRWDGIRLRRKPYKGQYPNWADCSAFVTWCLYYALRRRGVRRDIVNGANWNGGFTGTLLTHGKRVHGAPKKGDLVIYGRGGSGEHVAMYIGGGHVVSHGSEPGPMILPTHYRPDVMQVRRYI